MRKTTFEIPKMDCPSEENLIRMKLDGLSGIARLEFDIPNRRLTVFHIDQTERLEGAVLSLNLGGKILSTAPTEQESFKSDTQQKKVLWTVLAINFTFFLLESTTGWLADSMGLVADSLDMLADSLVYGMSLLVVGGTLSRKKQIAQLAGYFQIILALIGFVEVLRRFFGVEKMPDFSSMILVSILALLANALCLYLLQKSKGQEEAHMKASMIFTSNDIVINLGVIVAGILVYVTNSNLPDLIVGTVVFAIVLQGARRILKLAR